MILIIIHLKHFIIHKLKPFKIQNTCIKPFLNKNPKQHQNHYWKERMKIMKTDHVSLITYHLLIQKPSHILIENSISQNQETDTLCNVYYSKNLPISSFQICERKTMKQNHLMLCTNPKTFPYPH